MLLLVTELGSVLKVDDTRVSYLLASIGISVGFGSLIAGFLSRGKIRVILSKYAALGMAFAMFGIVLATVSYWSTLAYLTLLGLCAGLYAVPLQSLMQMLPTPAHRGRVLATSNAISFLFMAIGSLLFWLVRPWFGSNPYYIFVVCGVIAVIP